MLSRIEATAVQSSLDAPLLCRGCSSCLQDSSADGVRAVLASTACRLDGYGAQPSHTRYWEVLISFDSLL